MIRRTKYILEQVKKGRMSVDNAVKELKHLPFEDLKFAKIDHHRSLRKQCGEVIYCAGKTNEQIIEITKRVVAKKEDLLLTRANEAVFKAIKNICKKAEYNKYCKAIAIKQTKKEEKGNIIIITAGTSDIPVAEEAKITAEFLGNRVEVIYDVGVAGIHRLMHYKKKIEKAEVLIVVAGMEGALPSVVSGMFDKPIIAVPTSVGYGASFKGLSALLTMMNTCSPGISVVNIDNGFGAGYFASLVNK